MALHDPRSPGVIHQDIPTEKDLLSMSMKDGNVAEPTILSNVPAKTADPPAGADMKSRIMGIDVARGIALFAMIAAHVFDDFNSDGTPTIAQVTVVGRSATLFVMVAGISLAFITGRRQPPRGRAYTATVASVAARALTIGLIGLTLQYLDSGIDVILAYYAVFFLVAIPFLRVRPRILARIVVGFLAVGPIIVLGGYALNVWDYGNYLTLTTLVTNPADIVMQTFVAGAYPVVVYMAYILTGLALGRLDLSSKKLAVSLVIGGTAMATAALVTSDVLLHHLGGLQQLRAAVAPSVPINTVLWAPEDPVRSWWWLAVPGPHSTTPIDAVNTLGSALAVIGLCLLVTRLAAARRILRPLALAGSMTLTIYSAHLFVLASGLLDDNMALYLVLVAGALIFAVVWNRFHDQGPLEKLVATVAGKARRKVLSSSTDSTKPTRGGDDVVTVTTP
jgi:uncharacterized membrane protein YeiB